MHIRPALITDGPAVIALFKDFVDYLHSIGDLADYQFDLAKYESDGFGADPAFRGLLAESESRLAGYLLYSKGYDGDYRRYLYVVDIYVQPDFRGKGVGKQLMQSVFDVARREHIGRVSWSVHAKNRDAIAFYERLGAESVSDILEMHIDL